MTKYFSVWLWSSFVRLHKNSDSAWIFTGWISLLHFRWTHWTKTQEWNSKIFKLLIKIIFKVEFLPCGSHDSCHRLSHVGSSDVKCGKILEIRLIFMKIVISKRWKVTWCEMICLFWLEKIRIGGRHLFTTTVVFLVSCSITFVLQPYHTKSYWIL